MADDSLPSPDKDASSVPEKKDFGNFWSELRRRKVVRVAITYAVVAWVIIQVASTTFEGFGIPVWAYRFVMLCVILGFPLAMIFAWAFELTPDGIRTTKSARQEQDELKYHFEHHRKRNWMAYGLGAALPALIFGILAIFFFVQNRSLVSQLEVSNQVEEIDKSIAVLPFDNRSKLEDDEYFTDGIHDDLLTQISMIKDIKTISRTSVMAYKDTSKNLKTIGEELGVTTILEGGVQRSGDMIRINAQLIDASTDAHLWAKTYDRELTAKNVFRIQSEIAVAIADALKVVLSPEEKSDLERLPTQNLKALEAYFQAISLQGSGLLQKSIELLQRAIELDPKFADAHADLGRQILNRGLMTGRPREEIYPQVETLIDTALALDPRNAIAYRTIGRLNSIKQKHKEAEDAFIKAIKLRPSFGEAYANLSEILQRQGRSDESYEIIARGLIVDPHSRFLKEKHINLLFDTGRTEEANALFESYLEDYSDGFSYGFVVSAYTSQGKLDHAAKVLHQWHSKDPANTRISYRLSSIYNALGDEENAAVWSKRSVKLISGVDVSIGTRLYELIVNEKWQQAESFLKNNFSPANVSDIRPLSLYQWMHQDFKHGRMQDPITRYKYLFPQVFKEGYLIGEGLSPWLIKDIAVSLLAVDKPEQANILLQQLIEYTEKGQDMDLLVRLYSLTGDLESAIGIIQENPMGLASSYMHPDLENLRGHPEFESLMMEPLQKLQRQRQQLAEWEANGEMAPTPPLPVKQ